MDLFLLTKLQLQLTRAVENAEVNQSMQLRQLPVAAQINTSEIVIQI
jgi:hypothetical protein